jgi:hypothetical protein
VANPQEANAGVPPTVNRRTTKGEQLKVTRTNATDGLKVTRTFTQKLPLRSSLSHASNRPQRPQPPLERYAPRLLRINQTPRQHPRKNNLNPNKLQRTNQIAKNVTKRNFS